MQKKCLLNNSGSDICFWIIWRLTIDMHWVSSLKNGNYADPIIYCDFSYESTTCWSCGTKGKGYSSYSISCYEEEMYSHCKDQKPRWREETVERPRVLRSRASRPRGRASLLGLLFSSLPRGREEKSSPSKEALPLGLEALDLKTLGLSTVSSLHLGFWSLQWLYISSS